MKTVAIIMSEMDTGGVSEALIEMMRLFDYNRYSVTLWVANGTGNEQYRLDSHVQICHWGAENPAKELIEQLKKGHILRFCRSAIYRLLGRFYINCNDKHAFYCIRSFPSFDAEIYDYVICYQGVSPVVLPNALYRIRGRKRILWIHGDLGREEKLIPFYKRLYRQFDQAVAVSQTARDLFVHQYDYPIGRTSVFYNIVDAKRIAHLANQPLTQTVKHPAIVTVGRLSPEKGQIMIPATMKLLMDSGFDAWWYLVGDGCSQEKIQSEILRLGVAERVILLGRHGNPFPYMKAADIYVQTSFTEGWCLTVQEARLLGKAVVSTPVPAIMEQIVSGVNGLVCNEASPEALGCAISSLLNNAVLRQKMAEGPGPLLLDYDAEMERLYRILEN